MAENFYTILTTIGKAKLANSQVTGVKVDLSQMAAGDGNGSYYNPTSEMTELKKEVWRGNIGSIKVDTDNSSWIVIETVIPATDGGFMVREVGIFDTDGDMIAIGKYPETYKPVLADGSAKDLYIRMIIEVSSASNVTLKIDPTVIIASRSYVDNLVTPLSETVSDHTSQLSDIAINVKTLGAIGDGITDDTVAVQNALDTGSSVFFPKGTYSVSSVFTTIEGQKIFGEGTIKGRTVGSTFIVKHENVTIEGLVFDGGSATYSITNSGSIKGIKIVENTFKGNIGHWIVLDGENIIISKNVFDGRGFSQTTPIVMSGAIGFSISDNTFIDVTGFNIQTRWSKNGTISNNTFENPIQYSEIVATEGQTVFTFTLPVSVSRHGVQVNNVATKTGVTITNVGLVYTVTFTTGRVAGDVVKFAGFRSLENLNINSETYDVTISGNVLNGTGDSGIVLGADYHDTILDPNNVDSDDYPKRISIVGNVIKNCAYAGIAETHSVNSVSIVGNNISDCGIIEDFIYSSGVYLTAGETSVVGNTITNSEVGIMKYGVHVSSSPVSGNIDTDASVKLGMNTFSGIKDLNYFLAGSYNTATRKSNIIFTDGIEVPYPATPNLDATWVGTPALPPNDSYFSYGGLGGTQWFRDTTTKLGGVASLQTRVGEYAQVSLLAQEFFKECIMRITFKAKGTDVNAQGYARVYYGFAGDDVEPNILTTIKPGTDWKTYVINIVIEAKPSSLFVRIGGDVGGVNIQHIRFSMIPYGTLAD